MTITIVAGARPNFMKIAPIIEAITYKKKAGYTINYRLVHTGQHYDKNLSDTFFHELNIPFPDTNLEVKSGTQAEQTAAIMIGFEKELDAHPCDLVMVVGDVTSTMACTIVAKKAGIDVAHVEAGIRSGDMNMPEEINRIVTDSLTDYFFTTSSYANENLNALGVSDSNIFFVGNVMIDTLLKNKSRFNAPEIWSKLGLEKKKYMVMTLHRPSNVDEEQSLKSLITLITSLGKDYPIIFPVHPRTKKILERLDLSFDNLHYINPLGYLAFNYLVENAFAVLTDSGTCDLGTNMLVGSDSEKIKEAFNVLLSGNWKEGNIPELWDGNAANRIADCLVELYSL